MVPSRSSCSSVTEAQPISFWISFSISTTGETNSARASGSSGKACILNQTPMLVAYRPMVSHLGRIHASSFRSSGTT